jgi:integral membrane protein
MDALKTFRWVAIIEGISFVLLLFVAMPLKYILEMPLAVRIAGAAHGVLFLMFCGALFRVALERRWPVSRWALAFGSSLVPFGTFAFDRSVTRELREG